MFIGIDAGAGIMKAALPNAHGEPEILTNELGEQSFPSVLFFDKGRILVGTEAFNARFTDPSRYVGSWKPSLGQDKILYRDPSGRAYTATEVLAEFLTYEKLQAEKRTGQPVTQAVISVPANYTDERRAATLAAAKIAQLEVILLPNEPTAAALANDVHKRGNGKNLIVDIGHYTTDVSLIEVKGNNITVVATNGEPGLGGADFSNAILAELLNRFQKQCGFTPNPEEHPADMQLIETSVNQAKHTLASRNKAHIAVICRGQVLNCEITRAEFDKLTQGLRDRIVSCITETLQQARIKASELKEVLVVGGGSLIPAVAADIEKTVGIKLSAHVEPRFGAARGCIIAGRLELESNGQKMMVNGHALPPLNLFTREITAHNIGVTVRDDDDSLRHCVCIQKGTPIPCDLTKQFYLPHVDQTDARIEVLQGEAGVLREQCVILGHFDLTNLPSIRDKVHTIEVRLRIDQKTQILSASAFDPHCGQSADMTIDYAKVNSSSST